MTELSCPWVRGITVCVQLVEAECNDGRAASIAESPLLQSHRRPHFHLQRVHLAIIGFVVVAESVEDAVEDQVADLGGRGVFLLCGLAAGLIHTITNYNSPVPTIGASGSGRGC